MSIFGDFVRVRREELNLDQSGLGRQLGVNQQTVSRWEQAKAVPRPDRIRRLAEVLRVEVAELMRYAGYLPEDQPAEAASASDGPFHRLSEQLSGMTNDELIFLIDQAWQEYRRRVSVSQQAPRRRRSPRTGL